MAEAESDEETVKEDGPDRYFTDHSSRENTDMRIDLGDGLILRESTTDDIEALGEFFGKVFAGGNGEPCAYMPGWMADLLGGSHPTVSPSDFTIVEEANTGRIVSSCGYVSQIWRYEDIEFSVGQPEPVATHKDYRRRGLVRKQFDVLHRWSDERGHLVQAINGIPNYYRRFGYEMTIDKGGGRGGPMHHVPKLGKDETEAFRVRHATEDDLPFFMEMYDRHTSRLGISCVRDESVWRFDHHGDRKRVTSAHRIIERMNGDPVGAIAYRMENKAEFSPLNIKLYELTPGVSWLEATPSVLRWIKSLCAENAAIDTGTDGIERIHKSWFLFHLVRTHPVFEAIPEKLSEERSPYAWYIRVPDLPRFIKHITPVLERRLSQSAACGHSGELKINFFSDGLRIVLENGRLAVIEPWQPTVEDQGNTSFPDLTFLHLVFGYRTLDEIKKMYADCSANPEQAVILKAMFPKRPSLVWQIR
jgi:hypothetical protein